MKRTLEEVLAALMQLHQVLIAVVKKDYEAKYGPVGNPYALLGLLTSHPDFAWLRPMSGLMADLDELIEKKKSFSEDETGAVGAGINALFASHPDVPTEFNVKYLQALQDEPSLVMAHSRVKTALAKLPVSSDKTLAEVLAAARKGKRGK
ncbi:MAG: hypothetical protein IT462_07565 [Planctomycetes bacterium]|nr:hypothetical protein [Planctomycetota bacterium]